MSHKMPISYFYVDFFCRPSTPPGEYLRRRPFASHHLIPWALTLKEKKCIPCHREGCRFLAMSVEDMCTHYGSCIGDASFAPYHCSFCDGVVTSQNILDIHITLSHKDTRKESSPRVVSSLPKPHKFQPSILRRTSVIPKNSETKMVSHSNLSFYLNIEILQCIDMLPDCHSG